jgi:hypothetical protein
MRLRLLLALSLAIVSGACSSAGSSAGTSATDVDGASRNSVASSGSSGPSVGGGGEPSDADVGLGVSGGGSCPARADAAACSAPPSSVAPPMPPPNAPPIPLLGSYWVGCELTSCSSQTSCTTCSCVEADGGSEWECTHGGFQPEEDAQPTPYCALDVGPLDGGDIADAGPVEQCTPQYPTCTGPFPESPGWQCCLASSVGGISEIRCMPNDAAAYSGNFGRPP